MKVATQDRGEILHFAGWNGLSPALRDELPVFVTGHDQTATRCGWEPFFRAMGERHLVLVHDPDDPGTYEFETEDGTRELRHEHTSLGDAIAHARRFWKALFPGAKAQEKAAE